jgi:CRISPR-associated exonuclease Cas4
MEAWCIGAGVALVALAGLPLIGSGRLRRESGLPGGRISLSDVDAERRGTPLYSQTFRLAGTPDYLVETAQGLVPVEVKPSRTEPEPHESHLLQVLAYCLLVEEAYDTKPPYGLLRYKHDTFKVDYNSGTRAYIIGVLEEMRSAAQSREAHRSHEAEGRCRACTYRTICDESLTR